MAYCGGCDGACCALYRVSLTHMDVARIMGRGFMPSDFVDWIDVTDYDTVYPDVLIGSGYRYMVLRRDDSGVCCLANRENNALRCKVHGDHPLVCRIYPYDEISGGVMAGRVCPYPGVKDVSGLSAARRSELREYESLARRWNAFPRLGRGPADFFGFILGDL
jgi:Fe-S-cluster containining protein